MNLELLLALKLISSLEIKIEYLQKENKQLREENSNKHVLKDLSEFVKLISDNGYTIVPLKPTKEMCVAVRGLACFDMENEGAALIFKRMIEKSPSITLKR